MTRTPRRTTGLAATLLALAAGFAAAAQPAPPADFTARDRPLDGGDAAVLRWTPADAAEGVVGYRIERSMTEGEVASADAQRVAGAVEDARARVTATILGADWRPRIEELDDASRAQVRTARAQAGEAARATEEAALAAERARDGADRWALVGIVLAGENETVAGDLARGSSYRFRIAAIDEDGARSAWTIAPGEVTPRREAFDGSRFWLLMVLLVFGGSVVFFIEVARRGKPLKVRTIAGLAAVDEAVGRATEMGRSVLFVPGIQDMNEIQTIAGITILARVARTAAEYDARVEVPTSRSLVMTTARETVQAAFLEAGRPDAYNEDDIYYVTNEQFGYVAYLSGMMVRDKPAACIYMGAFYAESLILAETGNAIGAIQVAGTAQPAQLPFFVAACDYTLIGEEFFAASAYLSGEPEQLGSLKGQDMGKIFAAVLLVAGCLLATLAAVPGFSALKAALDFLTDTVLT